jgi:hypothetical protein
MTPLFHLWVRSTGEGQYYVKAEYEEVQRAQTIASFAPSGDFQTNISQLTSRIPGVRPRTLDDQLLKSKLLGEEIFRAFFTGPVLNLFRAYRSQNDEPRIALHIPRDLYPLPWEMLRDPQDILPADFLALFGSITRYDADATDYDPRSNLYPLSDSLTSLFLSPRPNATQEEEAVPVIEFESTTRVAYSNVNSGTYSDFLQSVNRSNFRPDAFIFFGHGRVENNIGKLVFVVMQGIFARRPIGEARGASDVARPLATKKMLRFGCVMACETAWCDRGMPFDGTVAGYLLLNTSLAFIVGAQLKMNFSAAEEFLVQMTRALHGEDDQIPDPLDLMLKQGRQAILALPPPACLDWWVPVMYAKTTTLALFAKPKIEMPTSSRNV